MEEHYHLCIFCLHYLFLQQLNIDLERFRQSWNCHSLSTEKKRRSPNQLLYINRNLNAALQVDEEWYGVEGDLDAIEADANDVKQVILDPLPCP